MNMDDKFNKLQQAKDREDEKIKLLVLQLLHPNGMTAVDASKGVLDSAI